MNILNKVLNIEKLNFYDDISDYYCSNHFYIKSTKFLPKLNQITMTHTSKSVHDNSTKAISIVFTFLLISLQEKFDNKKISIIKSRKGMASFGIQKFDHLGVKLVINKNLNNILKQFFPLSNKYITKNNNKNSYNSAFNSLLTFKNIDKFFDLFESQFKNLNQFGCKFVLNTTAIDQLHHIFYLSILNNIFTKKI